MTEREKHIAYLFTAELQFRLASAVRLATAQGIQPLDLPIWWVHGEHKIEYKQIALRPDQADFAAHHLHDGATFLMAVAIKDAIRAVVKDPKTSGDSRVRAAYEIARLIRNAFAHGPFSPTWSIDADCRDRIFQIKNVITLDTKGLHGISFRWEHYGGPIALFRLCRFVRITILKDKPKKRKSVPLPTSILYQHGDLILKKVESIPTGTRRIKMKTLPDGSVDLGGGYRIGPAKSKEQ